MTEPDDGGGPPEPVDPWSVDRVPSRWDLAGRLGVDSLSAGQRYTAAIAVVFALLVVIFSEGGSSPDDAGFLAGIADAPAAGTTPVTTSPTTTLPAPVPTTVAVPAPLDPGISEPTAEPTVTTVTATTTPPTTTTTTAPSPLPPLPIPLP